MRAKNVVSGAVKDIRITYGPLPKQAEAHALSTKYRGFCGGWGNGKTSWGCAETFMRLHEYPGTNCIIARATRPELKSTTWDMFLNGDGSDVDTRWPGVPRETIATYNRSDLYLEFRNGSKIWGLPLDDPKKLENYNLGFFWIDQAEEIPEDIALKFQGRLRQRTGPREGIFTFNPDGHNWLWKRFIDPNRVSTWKTVYGVVEATPFDNPFLPEDYLEQFKSLPQSWQDRYVYGSHDVFVGQIFTDWDPEVHIIPDFAVPSSWERWMCFDPGMRHEGAATWMVRDPEGRKFYYREVLASGQPVAWWANKIYECEQRRDVGGPNEQVVRRLIGPEANQRSQNDGKSVKDIFWEHGIAFEDADRDPNARITTVTDHLRPNDKWVHPLTGESPAPALYVFASCAKLAEYIAQYRWKPVRSNFSDEAPPERPRKKDDHNIDNLGHILLDMQLQPELGDDYLDSGQVSELDRHFTEVIAQYQQAAVDSYSIPIVDEWLIPTDGYDLDYW